MFAVTAFQSQKKATWSQLLKRVVRLMINVMMIRSRTLPAQLARGPRAAILLHEKDEKAQTKCLRVRVSVSAPPTSERRYRAGGPEARVETGTVTRTRNINSHHT